MCKDKIRLDAYKAVINHSVKGKIVVEIGTGETLPLALTCVESGASLVYAIEENKNTVEAAQRLIEQLGVSDKIKLIFGSATAVELPEQADVCVSEIIGCIGSSEGAIVVLENAKRFLNPNGKLIPDRCVTKFAPVCLPDNMYHDEFLEKLVDHYTPLVYQSRGKIFPFTRFKVFNLPPSQLLAKPELFEDVSFNHQLVPNFTNSATFHISSDGVTRLSSFLPSLWSAIRIIAPCLSCAIILMALQRYGAIILMALQRLGGILT
ncbi:MAG: hypothetical protein BWK78_03165 [Thiotrichaceae bacterium IS1]|nr:MAG: hypothetical protein BWK78_03165 [Thiotrichaceae bacterium IS1]